MFSHQPTWDDCQQRLQMLLTTEEREKILLEAKKIARNEIDMGFPLTRPS